MNPFRLVLVLPLLLSPSGCIEDSPSVRDESVAPGPAPSAPSPWRGEGAAGAIAIPDDDVDVDAALDTAIERAQRSVSAARDRWAAASEDDRRHWAVKWAAPTVDGGVEYLWVEPQHWSPFRVEGRLANAPQRPLACERGLDELVGFPADEIVDWLHAPPGGPIEGGFTRDVLRSTFGAPE